MTIAYQRGMLTNWTPLSKMRTSTGKIPPELMPSHPLGKPLPSSSVRTGSTKKSQPSDQPSTLTADQNKQSGRRPSGSSRT